MKKITMFIVLLCVTVSFVVADSYEQTAADISPGVFAEGSYFFPSSIFIGTDEDPELSSPASLYITDGSNNLPLYVLSSTGYAIYSLNTGTGSAVYGYAEGGRGVFGRTDSTSTSYAAIYGYATAGAPAVYGYDNSGSGIGVKAYSTNYGFYTSGADYGLYIPNADSYGVYVASSDNIGGKFEGDSYGVQAVSDGIAGYFSGDVVGVYGVSDSSTSLQCGVQAYNTKSGNLGYLGCYNYGLYTPDDAKVDGTLRVGSCSGCDIAEHFIGDNLEAGDVVVLDPTNVRGVKKTTKQYNKLAAGIVSTDPTLTMGIDDGVPIALSGVVPTKVIGTVNVGDLLTTSSTAGYAMACADYQKCQGAIIGKAMEKNTGGKGTITALVMLG